MEKPKRDWMILADLPDKFNIGRLPLRPLNAVCRRLTPCYVCRCYSDQGFIGVCGHSFCLSCVSLPLSKPDEDITHLWCNLCQAKREAAINDEDTPLESMKFACACGFQGDLEHIKKHFWSDHDTHKAVPGGQEFDGLSFRGEPKASSGARKSRISHERINDFAKRLDALRVGVALLSAESAGLVERVGGLQACDGHHGHGVFWIQVKNLIDRYRATDQNVFTPIYKWYANGLPIGTQFTVGSNNEGVVYFGALHRATFGESSECRQYRLLIGTKVRKLDGLPERFAMTATAQGRRPVSDAFKSALPDFVNGGCGPSDLMKVDTLMRPGANIVTANGLVCVEVEVLASLDNNEQAAEKKQTDSWWGLRKIF